MCGRTANVLPERDLAVLRIYKTLQDVTHRYLNIEYIMLIFKWDKTQGEIT